MILVALSLLAAASDASPVPVSAKPDPLICKKTIRTGSRTASRRVCATEHEWRVLGERARRDVEDMQSRGRPEKGPVF